MIFPARCSTGSLEPAHGRSEARLPHGRLAETSGCVWGKRLGRRDLTARLRSCLPVCCLRAIEGSPRLGDQVESGGVGDGLDEGDGAEFDA